MLGPLEYARLYKAISEHCDSEGARNLVLPTNGGNQTKRFSLSKLRDFFLTKKNTTKTLIFTIRRFRGASNENISKEGFPHAYVMQLLIIVNSEESENLFISILPHNKSACQYLYIRIYLILPKLVPLICSQHNPILDYGKDGLVSS